MLMSRMSPGSTWHQHAVRGELTGTEPRREEPDMGWGCTNQLLPLPVRVGIFEIFQDAEQPLTWHQFRGLVEPSITSRICLVLCKLFLISDVCVAVLHQTWSILKYKHLKCRGVATLRYYPPLGPVGAAVTSAGWKLFLYIWKSGTLSFFCFNLLWFSDSHLFWAGTQKFACWPPPCAAC